MPFHIGFAKYKMNDVQRNPNFVSELTNAKPAWGFFRLWVLILGQSLVAYDNFVG